MEGNGSMTKTDITEPRECSVKRAVLVGNHCYLGGRSGGVQWCSHEYVETLKAADFELVHVGYSPPTDLPSRFVRKFFPAPFRGLYPRHLLQRIIAEADKAGTRAILLNNAEAAALAPELRQLRKDLCLIYLSHGVEITDVVNNLRIIPGAQSTPSGSARWLGKLLQFEIQVREAVDAVVCISNEDVVFEQWLGARRCLYLERQVPNCPLILNPVAGRIGSVGTLDHGPNIHGLRCLAESLLGVSSLELRLVGGPTHCGQALEREFPFIRYLGRLDDEALRKEAATWCAFVNPIFCQARGASTKVATALGWRLPVLTTVVGGRGYRWDDAALPRCGTSEELARLCLEVVSRDADDRWVRGAYKVACMAPSLQESAGQLRSFLIPLFENGYPLI